MRNNLLVAVVISLALLFISCGGQSTSEPVSTTGVKKAEAVVQTDQDGHTAEQVNIVNRLAEDNKPGSVKHLYVISAFSGQVIIYSTVKGKVTSGGKRLTPTEVVANASTINDSYGIPVNIGGSAHRTSEVLQDDGTYGHSSDYLYWWDTKGVYHQHYISGGQIVHISNEPLAVKGIMINMQLNGPSVDK